MSSSKDYYASTSYLGKATREDPVYEIGKRFTVDFGYNKSEKGTWEITKLETSPFYDCVRVLKNGGLSKSLTMANKRSFHVSLIKQALNGGNLG